MRLDPYRRHLTQRSSLLRRGYVRRRFRWYLVTVPLAILFFVWLGRGIQPSLSWDQVMDGLGVQSRERYTRLATLGVIVTAIVVTLRILRGPREDENE